ncbi:hypothetical protein BGY98DRAFT_943485 [Russula aff. rugulosa BPL654]|nr:hypothetical protein BGY98DRAFT_943485 [Russula aff. rugulosa BPL654]
MISKSFPIQAFVALLTIASSLTSPVNAAAVIPGPFSRDLRRDSVPASMTARFIEERQTTAGCNLNAYDYFCIVNQESFIQCKATAVPQDLAYCLSQLCPNSSQQVITCVMGPPPNGNPNLNDQGLDIN